MHNAAQTKPIQEGTQWVGCRVGSPGVESRLAPSRLVRWEDADGESERMAFWTTCHVLPVMCRSCRWPIPMSAPISNSLCQKAPWPYSPSPHLNSTQPRSEIWVQILVKNSLTLSMLANPAESQFPQQKSAPHCVQRGLNKKIRIKCFHSYLHKRP